MIEVINTFNNRLSEKGIKRMSEIFENYLP